MVLKLVFLCAVAVAALPAGSDEKAASLDVHDASVEASSLSQQLTGRTEVLCDKAKTSDGDANAMDFEAAKQDTSEPKLESQGDETPKADASESTQQTPVAAESADPHSALFGDVSIDAAAFGASCKAKLEEAKVLQKELSSLSAPTKVAVLHASNKLDVLIGNIASLAQLLKEVHPDEKMRETATNCSLAADELATEMSLDRDLFEIVQRVENDTAIDVLDQRKFDRMLRMFRRSGVSLPDEASRQRVFDLTSEIEQLSTQFSLNLNNDTRVVERDASDTAALAGLDPDFIEAHTKDGKVRISTDYPDLQPTLKFAENEDLRRDLYVTNLQRGLPRNLDILSQVLAKRHEKATLLGYKSWAHYAIEVMMMGSDDKADDFLSGVAEISRERSNEEIGQLLKAKQAAGVNSGTVYPYDSSFYSEKVRRESFEIDSKMVHPYFRYSNTRDGVIMLAEKMFGVEFTPRPSVRTWHPDVTTYDISWAHDPDTVIGRIYLDMFPRQFKYKHAAQFPMRAGVEGVQRAEGALVCNFPKTGPMEHSQVVTFFHEFGHLMHHVIGGVGQRYAEFSGVATEWDFVEAPSQMLENWAYDLPTLQKFAKHEKTGEPIPEGLVAKLKEAESFGRGINAMQQTFYAKLSLHLHNQDPSNFAVTNLFLDLSKEYAPFPHVQGTNMAASFGHLMGYSAVYFTYLWSQAIAQHMLAVFKGSGSLTNPNVALQYRDLVLRPGGTRDARKLVFDFSDKELNLDAFHAYLHEGAH
jgi:thimet oligopeptidase